MKFKTLTRSGDVVFEDIKFASLEHFILFFVENDNMKNDDIGNLKF